MPNHCETDLTITATPEVIHAIAAAHFTPDGALDCDSLIPYPAKLRALDDAAQAWREQYGDATGYFVRADLKDDPTIPPRPKDGFNSGGYEWCLTNWGTKWGTYEPRPMVIEEDGKTATLRASFESAWAPPTPVLHVLAERYPTAHLVADSYEGGCGFHLHTEWTDGECSLDEEHSYAGPRGG